MPTTIATHNGPFHADDAMATALIRLFVDPQAEVTRTRAPERIATADIVLDVGGEFQPENRRFDHHQASYTGTRSSAGMVLDWLQDTDQIATGLAKSLRHGLMEYLDAVDTGRTAPSGTVPCFPRIVDALNQPAESHEEFDAAFEKAVQIGVWFVDGLRSGHEKIERARTVIRAAMDDAATEGRNVLFLDAYYSWKTPYFDNGGSDHPTEYVLFPGTDDSWRIIAIPPAYGEFGQKRSLPESWAGLSGEALESACGVRGAVFCHKNRFIAVFETREGAIEALETHGLLRR